MRRLIFVVAIALETLQKGTTFSSPQNWRPPTRVSLSDRPLTETITENHSGTDGAVSSLQSLDYFLGKCCEANHLHGENTILIVPRGSSKKIGGASVTTSTRLFFHRDTNGTHRLVVVIVSESKEIDREELQRVYRLSSGEEASLLKPVTEEQAELLYGFSSSYLPPFGFLAEKANIVTIIDAEVMDHVKNGVGILTSAGNPYWQCFIGPSKVETILNTWSNHVTVADLGDNSSREIVANHAIQHSSTRSDEIDQSAEYRDLLASLETLLPPSNIARIVGRQRELLNPLVPSLVTVEGKVRKLQRISPKVAHCELIPGSFELANSSNDPSPWTGSKSEQFAIRLIFGKALHQQFGPQQCQVAIDRLQEVQTSGFTIRVMAKTHVGNRESLTEWANTSLLDLLVVNYETYFDNTKADIATSLETYKHKATLREPTPILPPLTLKDIFPSTGGRVVLVDGRAGIHAFANDIEKIIPTKSIFENVVPMLVGIDCEWQPHQLMVRGEPRPVICMQISLPFIETVYLLDLQKLLRPLQHPTQGRTDLEEATDQVLARLLVDGKDHPSVIKTGYHIVSDLQRLAGSYPHLSCFQQDISNLLEVDTLVRKSLQLLKQKKSRGITTSLSKMTSHYLSREIQKDCQVSDWQKRPLTSSQVEYAALDAAVVSSISRRALEAVQDVSTAKSHSKKKKKKEPEPTIPQLLSKNLQSVRFDVLLSEEDPSDGSMKRIVGDAWVAYQQWDSVDDPPPR